MAQPQETRGMSPSQAVMYFQGRRTGAYVVPVGKTRTGWLDSVCVADINGFGEVLDRASEASCRGNIMDLEFHLHRLRTKAERIGLFAGAVEYVLREDASFAINNQLPYYPQ